MRTLLTLLGTNAYVPARYQLGEPVSSPTRYVQVALAELLPKTGSSIDRVVVLLTEEARAKHWEALSSELADRGYSGPRLAEHAIPSGANEDELWELFGAIGRAVDGSSSVILDATHGFRSLQLVTLLALAFYRNARELSVERVLYGAFETLGSAREVQARYVETGEAETAPVFDLTEMLLLPQWAEAAGEWARSGSASGLLELSAGPAQAARKAMRGSDDITTLAGCVRNVGHVLSLVRHEDVSVQAEKARGVARRIAPDSVVANARLAPMRAVGQLLARSLESIAIPVGDPKALDSDYLRSQLALARYYEERERMLEAYSVLRELWVSCVVRVARVAAPGARWVQRDRDSVAHVVSLSFKHRKEGDSALENAGVRRILETHPELRDILRRADQGIRERRNALDHCWVGKEGPWNVNLLDKVRAEHRKAAVQLERAIELLGALEPIAPEQSCFVNLTNHPSAEWPERQRKAALEHAPTIVDVPFPSVDPQAAPKELKALRNEVLAKLPKGTTHALVMGEMTLTFALVRELQTVGVECLATAGPRIVETAPDGRRISRFQFESFRSYRV